MSISQPFRRGLIACVLLSTALSSAALTLGRSRGIALVGRTLDVAIPVTLDSAGQAAELCAEADVFHGDTRVDASRVTARIEPASGLNAVVRVRSSQAVDEPVVTVYLRLGCNQKVTRRYVLLAEEPTEVVAPLVAPAPAAAAVAPSARQAPPPPPAAAAAPAPAAVTQAPTVARAATPARSGSRARRSAEATMTPRGPAVARADSALAPKPPRSQPLTRATTRGGRPRLTVDMVDLTPERDPQLRSSAGLAGAPSTDEQVRAQAAALWRAINAQPEDVLRDLQRVQALETDVKDLRTLVTGNDRTLAELRGQLEQARQERTLTLAAIALLTLLLAAMVVTWWLRRGERGGSREWWRRRDPAADAAAGGLDPAGRPLPPGAPPVRPADMDLRVDESMFESLKKPPRVAVVPVAAVPQRTAAPAPVPARAAAVSDPAGPASNFHSSFQSSQISSMRMVKAEELVDIQQQADFFMSLGQTEQAIEVLESHIHHNAETSALVWLDLLAIYRALKRRQDYELLRSDFQRVFNAEVPSYDSTPTASGGLEDYPRALTRIAALWPSPKVMDVIEESIFRKPGVGGAEPFDLEAYRELVMLYNLGREVVGAQATASEDWSASQQGKSSFFETSMQPLSVARHGSAPVVEDSILDSALDSGPGAQTGLGDMMDLESMLDSGVDDEDEPRTTGSEFHDPRVPRPSPRLGLDIDLTDPAASDRKPAQDSNSIDFELAEPDTESGAGKPDLPVLPDLPARPQ
jgi:pilus assembly protein FimV